ncbi:MAG: anti-sigma factor [Pseudolysinimonas sp.]
MTRDELMTAAGAYALGALAEPEKSEFEALMAESEQLRAEVTELMDTAVELGLSVAPVDPPSAMRDSILASIATTPQLASESRSSSERSERVETPRPATPAEFKARSRWRTPLARLGAVAAAIALVAGLGVTLRFGIQVQNEMATVSQINEIQAADDYQRVVVDLEDGASVTAVWSSELHRAALMVDGWRDLPPGSTYELWYMDAEGAATPAGTFDVDGEGSRNVVLAGAMSAGDAIGVTVEPAGGSKTPSDEVVVVMTTA